MISLEKKYVEKIVVTRTETASKRQILNKTRELIKIIASTVSNLNYPVHRMEFVYSQTPMRAYTLE